MIFEKEKSLEDRNIIERRVCKSEEVRRGGDKNFTNYSDAPEST